MAQTTGVMNGTLMTVTVGGVAIDMQTECSISLSMETRDITSKDSSGFRELLEGLRSGSVTFSALHAEDNTYNIDDLFALWNTRASATVNFTTANTGDKEFSATAYLTSFEQSAGTEDNVTISGTFELTGAITYTVIS
jgi:TP901-1 family phage major tail protein